MLLGAAADDDVDERPSAAAALADGSSTATADEAVLDGS
jgi:hypothetical protein